MVIFLLVFGFGRVWPKTGLGIILPGGVQSWSSFWSLWRSSLLIGCLWRWPSMTQSTRLTPLISHRTAWLSSWYRWISTWSGSTKAGFTTTGFLIPVIAEIFALCHLHDFYTYAITYRKTGFLWPWYPCWISCFNCFTVWLALFFSFSR